MRIFVFIILASLSLTFTLPAAAQTLSNGQTIGQTAFSAVERRVISDWFQKNSQPAPSILPGEPYPDQGKQKHKGNKKHGKGGNVAGMPKGLPPGIAKNYARGKPLPPGIAKRYLPNDLVTHLPTPPAGYQRVIVGADVLLVEIATNTIVDMISDIVK